MGAGEKRMPRRKFFKKAAATGAAVAAGTTFLPSFRALGAARLGAPAESGKWKPTTCQGCTSWCSAEAYVVDGRAIKVRGNSRSKDNGGNSCPKMHLAIQQAYDPDRVKMPMKRTNP